LVNLPSTVPSGAKAVAAAETPSGNGTVTADGYVFVAGDAVSYGSLAGVRLAKPIEGMAITPSGHGYWLVASDGGVFTFGDAGFCGSTGDRSLTAPVVGMVTSGSGAGYWLIGADRQVYRFDTHLVAGRPGPIDQRRSIARAGRLRPFMVGARSVGTRPRDRLPVASARAGPPVEAGPHVNIGPSKASDDRFGDG
jgi:hypothetical protein